MSYIKGIDISNNNGSVNFSQVASDNVKYVYVKATEGATFKDSTMSDFYNNCKSNGLKVGAYHFLVGTSTPEAQATNFYSMIKDYDWNLVPMLDIETNFDSLTDYIVRFITVFKQLSSLELGIYSYTAFISNLTNAEETIKDMPFWEANFNNDPWNLPSNFFTSRVGHQYTENGSVNGVSGDCDMDSFTEGVLLNNTTTTSGTWILDDTGYWYKHADGSYTTNGWEYIDGKWYFFNSEGYMVYDWKKDGNSWYYLGNLNDGVMRTGWCKDVSTNIWYYFNNSGEMQTGWQEIGGNWYYFDHTGAMKTGWIKVDNKDYCLYSDGSMIHDRNMYGYSFDSNGVATKIS